MKLTVVWSAQARTQLHDSLRHIAQEDPVSAELVQKRLEKSL
jgi:plasmid stabilization system protein ParE